MDDKNKEVLKQYICPNCGGSIGFDAKSQKLKCPYCDTEFSVDQLEAFKQINKDQNETNIAWKDRESENFSEDEKNQINHYKCVSCSAEIMTDKNTIAAKCPYCGSSIVIVEKLKDSYRPDYVVGFRIDKKQMMERYKKFISTKKFIPDDFKIKNVVKNIKSVYLPFWLYSGNITADVSYIGKKTSFFTDSKFDYIDTSFYAVRRKGRFDFKNLPVDGSLNMDDELMEAIEPFLDEDIKDFNTGYLAGYMAERYDEDADVCKKRADERAKKMADDIIKSSLTGYESLVTKKSSVSIDGENPKYALMPVYLLNTNYNDEKFTFAMNGQTGKVVGNLPVDQKKVMVYFIKNTVLYTVILFLFIMTIYYLYLNL